MNRLYIVYLDGLTSFSLLNIFFLVFFFLLIAVYTFEVATHLNDFSVPSTSSLELSTTRYKDGAQSLKWTWAAGDAITHSFTTNVSHLLLAS